MNHLIAKSLTQFHQELSVHYEVHHLLRDMVESVSLYHLQNEYGRVKENYQLTQGLNEKLIKRIQWIEKEYTAAKHELESIKSEAITVRQRFVNQIGSFLAENRLNQKLKKRVSELEEVLATIKANEVLEATDGEADSSNERKKVGEEEDQKDGAVIAAVEGEEGQKKDKATVQPTPATPIKKPKNPLKLLTLEETPLLHLLSFLQTAEVLSYAQVCRFVYQRMDKIFGIDSATVKPDWATIPPPPNLVIAASPSRVPSMTVLSAESVPSPLNNKPLPTTHTTASNSNSNSNSRPEETAQSEVRLTREIIDELTKRLTPQQMKLILSIAERLKRQAATIELLSVEKEDLSSRLGNTESVRDFLIEKLKTAELAIKSMMNEVSTLKKQSASDSEIVSYLDLQVQDLEGQLLEANHRCSHLQASLELQVNSLSLKEEQLTAELEDWKDKYEKMEVNYKSQKKILVKEVKLLRGKVEELSQEKNLNTTRMQKLKEALDLSSSFR